MIHEIPIFRTQAEANTKDLFSSVFKTLPVSLETSILHWCEELNALTPSTSHHEAMKYILGLAKDSTNVFYSYNWDCEI